MLIKKFYYVCIFVCIVLIYYNIIFRSILLLKCQMSKTFEIPKSIKSGQLPWLLMIYKEIKLKRRIVESMFSFGKFQLKTTG